MNDVEKIHELRLPCAPLTDFYQVSVSNDLEIIEVTVANLEIIEVTLGP